ncbi:MAG: shikimate dehydrogenase [Saprospiraceae bacterium]|nr:shikimate dehydrogenase [Saprospiraceae bacterium]
MIRLGLIGYPLSHSFSPDYFARKFEKEDIQGYDYDLYPITTAYHLQALLQFHPEIKGLNVTVPYKETVMAFVDELDPQAEAIGAVNTLVFKDGKIFGHNTDVGGFKNSLEALIKRVGAQLSGALILGTGGASKAVAYCLNEMGLAFKKVSRNPDSDQFGYADISAETLQNYNLIINTTPLGTYPNVELCPAIPYEKLGHQNLLFDLVYNPEKTLFLKKGESQGASIQNGLEMLEIQAELSWKLWTS